MRRWTVVEDTLKCCIKGCEKDAVHVWGKETLVPFCCRHFTELIIEIFDMREAIFTRVRQDAIVEFDRRIRDIVEHHSHIDALFEYQRRMQRNSRIADTHCEADDEKKP